MLFCFVFLKRKKTVDVNLEIYVNPLNLPNLLDKYLFLSKLKYDLE
jgi:hypothetical protein